MLVAATALCAPFVGCAERNVPVDPDGDPHAHAKNDASVLREVSLREVVAALAGVPSRDAATALEGWLSASDAGRRLMAQWPRTGAGALDLDRAPIVATSLTGFVAPGSKSRCGEVTVLFGTPKASNLPTVRARLPVPASLRECRGIVRESHREGTEALPLLKAAIADARVPTVAESF